MEKNKMAMTGEPMDCPDPLDPAKTPHCSWCVTPKTLLVEVVMTVIVNKQLHPQMMGCSACVAACTEQCGTRECVTCGQLPGSIIVTSCLASQENTHRCKALWRIL